MSAGYAIVYYGLWFLLWVVIAVVVLVAFSYFYNAVVKGYNDASLTYTWRMNKLLREDNDHFMEETITGLQDIRTLSNQMEGNIKATILSIEKSLKSILLQLEQLQIDVNIRWTEHLYSRRLKEVIYDQLEQHYTIEEQLEHNKTWIQQLKEAEQNIQVSLNNQEIVFSQLEQNLMQFADQLGTSIVRFDRQQKSIRDGYKQVKQLHHTDTFVAAELMIKTERKYQLLQQEYDQIIVYHQYSIQFEQQSSTTHNEIDYIMQNNQLRLSEPYKLVIQSEHKLVFLNKAIRNGDLLQTQSLWDEMQKQLEQAIQAVKQRVELKQSVIKQTAHVTEILPVLTILEQELSLSWVQARNQWVDSIWDNTFKLFQKNSTRLAEAYEMVKKIEYYVTQEQQQYTEAEQHLNRLNTKVITIEQEFEQIQKQLKDWQRLYQKLPQDLKNIEVTLEECYEEARKERMLWQNRTELLLIAEQINEQRSEIHTLFAQSIKDLHQMQINFRSYSQLIYDIVNAIERLIFTRDQGIKQKKLLSSAYKWSYRRAWAYIMFGEHNKYKTTFKQCLANYKSLTTQYQYEEALKSLEPIKSMIQTLEIIYKDGVAIQQAKKYESDEQKRRQKIVRNTHTPISSRGSIRINPKSNSILKEKDDGDDEDSSSYEHNYCYDEKDNDD